MKGAPTPVSLLLTNLRLLDFDFESFPITSDAFSQSSANKSKTFEHIVHHLYHTFDPEECDLKLHRCWPVYEGAQGKELRTVVYAWLEELKKSGRLPGVLLRRSTLDDCAGVRYEELMLALSTMVLRKRIEAGAFGDVVGRIPSFRIATSSTPSMDHIDPLNCAHEYALRSIADSRKRSKARWESLSGLLDDKEAEIKRVEEKIGEGEAEEENPAPRKPYGYEDNIRNKWKNNWIGEPKWLDILLNGDPESTRDHLLELPFDQAVRDHRRYMGDYVPGPKGVPSLKELEHKVKVQQERVERMRQLKERIGFSAILPNSSSPTKTLHSTSKDKRGLKVIFRRHQDLHYGKATIPRRRSTMRQNEYSELLSSLQNELILASGPGTREREESQRPEPRRVQYDQRPAISPVYNYAEDAMEVDEAEPAEESFVGSQPSPTRHKQKQQDRRPLEKPEAAPTGAQSGTNSENDDNERFDDDDVFLSLGIVGRRTGKETPVSDSDRLPVKISQNVAESSRASYQELSEEDEVMTDAPGPTPQKPMKSLKKNQFDDIPYLEPPKSKPRTPINESMDFLDDDLLAQQIISGITKTAFSPEKPSPAKPKLDQPPYAYNPISRPPPTTAPESPPPPSFTLNADSNFSSFTPRAAESTMAMPSMLDSTILDDSNLRTPRSAPPVSTTPKEDLLISEDYSSVFKSRPKVALSPPFSPVRLKVPEESDDEEELRRMEEMEEVDMEVEVSASPLGRKNRRW